MTDFLASAGDTLAYVGTLMPALLKGTLITVELFAVTLVLSLPLGLPIALGETSKIRVIRWICNAFVFVFRGTPLMLQLFFFYFFFPIYLGIKFPPFQTAAFTFILNYAAYFAEIYRGGINSIDRGQYEAAHSLGLSKVKTMFGIIIPQTMKVVLPPISNEAIVLIKDTALVSVIAVAELMKVSRGIANRDVNMLAYVIAAAIYLVFTFLLTLVLKYIEKRFSRYDNKEEW
ncbi:MAG: amino acid ABC transporter permease [Eubacteriaceae bacterium]|nr:amino acid ABC transporter permease [Eubacteriaceae bacterium]